MVADSTMTERPSGPSLTKVFFDQWIFPLCIDAAGFAEAGLEHIATATRRAPVRSIGIAAGAGVLISLVTLTKAGR